MRLKKVFMCIALILISVTTLCGCANIEFIRAIDSSNTIIDKLAITLDESKINKAGRVLSNGRDGIIDKIESDMQDFIDDVKDWKKEFEIYPDLNERVKNGIKVEASKPRKNEISLSLEFDSWEMFGLFYGYAVAEDFEYTEFMADHGPFIDRILNQEYENNSYGLFLIKYSILKNSGIGKDVQDYEYKGKNYYTEYKNYMHNNYDLSDVDISQIFAYPDDRLYSNADDKEVQGDLTLLRWDLNNKSEDFELTIYKVAANSSNWYILALIISAVSVVIIIFVINRKSKNQIEVRITKGEVEKDG